MKIFLKLIIILVLIIMGASVIEDVINTRGVASSAVREF